MIVMKKDLKICCISSHGGHLHELEEALKDVDQSRMYWVTYKTKHTQMVMERKHRKCYFIIDPVTNKLLFGVNAIQSLWHLMIERPNVVISTGAGMAFPTLFLSKKIFRAKIIYIESAAAVVDATKTARMVYPMSDLFLIQWEGLKTEFPNAIFTGGVL